eukprot:m.164890 g.164890  ORF g.164890 m.164890 type:complete len:448 (-) comp17144_c3_seq2:924-2267(-)
MAAAGLGGAAVVAVAAAVSMGLLLTVDREQPTPYMDELFHCRQAQHYCRRAYDVWDPMITTLPGLYILSAGLLEAWAAAVGGTAKQLCSVTVLRATNWLLWLACIIVVQRIIVKQQRVSPGAAWLHALVVCLFPLLFFFSFLYYTDVGSTLLVLSCYYLALSDRPVSSALVGGLSVLFRQTNIVWVVFSAGVLVLQREKLMQPGPLSTALTTALQRTLGKPLQLLELSVPYLIVGACFGAFLVQNDGIVVGDRSNHVSVLHVPQLFYCAAFTVFFAAPHIAHHIMPFYQSLRQPTTLLTLAAVTAACMYCVREFTHEHPYLLADNRHITFYVWKNISRRFSLARYFVVPAYVAAGALMQRSLAHRGPLFWWLFVAITALAIVPARLLEFRYFLLPYLLFRLNLAAPSTLQLLAEAALYVAVNAVTIYVFLNHPFTWPHEPGVQRFMW